MKRGAWFAVTLVAAAAALVPAPASAGTVSKEVEFELGKWIELEVTDGPATVHRFRLAEVVGTLRKSDFVRPFSPQYLRTVQLQLEYSNSATRDWEAAMLVEWLDADGAVIDGYDDSEDLESKEVRDVATVTLATFKYGLAKARKLRVKIDFGP